MNHTGIRNYGADGFLYADSEPSSLFSEENNPADIALTQLSVYSKRNFVAITSLMPINFKEQAETMIRRTGDRATSGRVQILAILLAEQRAVTHHEIEQRLSGEQRLDRVTLYRVLEWLNKRCFVHRVASDDRVWRFRANFDAHSHQHAHFKCTRCTRVICLDELKARYDGPLPAGYRSQAVELIVKGLCAECA